MDSKEDSDFTIRALKNDEVVKSEEEQPICIRKLSKVPLVAHIIVLSMCIIYSAISAFVKIVDTMDSWQISSHRNTHFNISLSYILICI